MLIKVAEILQFPGLAGYQVLAGKKGLERQISQVNVADVPDIHKWIKGGEFLITTAFFAKDNPLELADLIRRIDQAGASALGIKLQRFIDHVPDAVIQAADELDFPLIALPPEAAFVDIINTVLSSIVNQQAARLELSERIHREFTQLVLLGGDSQEIINTLGRITGERVVYVDSYFHDGDCYYSDGQDSSFAQQAIKHLLQNYAHEPVTFDQTTYGYIFMPERLPTEELEDTLRIALEHASTVLKLSIQKKIGTLEVESRYRDLLLQDLIYDNVRSQEELAKRAASFGWTFLEGMVVMILDIDDFKRRYLELDDQVQGEPLEQQRRRLVQVAHKVMLQYFQQVYYTSFSDNIVLLLPIRPGQEPGEFLREVRTAAEDVRKITPDVVGFTVTIGIGRYKPDVLAVHESYQEAKEAVRLGRLIHRQDHTVFFDELGAYRLLVPIYQSKEADEFVEATLGKLLQHDQQHGTELVATLEAVVAADWNLRAASEGLFVHYNTMKNRMSRINELLGLPQNQADHKLRIALALRLRQMGS